MRVFPLSCLVLLFAFDAEAARYYIPGCYHWGFEKEQECLKPIKYGSIGEDNFVILRNTCNVSRSWRPRPLVIKLFKELPEETPVHPPLTKRDNLVKCSMFRCLDQIRYECLGSLKRR